MAITVQELTEIPFLRTTLFAGAAGAGNQINWAHSNEMSHPWEWIDPGDLLMTVGMGIPKAPGEQVKRIEAFGVSGVAIGSDMFAPPLSDEMIATADRAKRAVRVAVGRKEDAEDLGRRPGRLLSAVASLDSTSFTDKGPA